MLCVTFFFFFSDGLFFLKAECHRSKKKNSKPYSVIAAIDRQGAIVDGSCECAAGKLACNHLMAMLRTVSLLQAKGFSEPPELLSCTDLPQQWRVPRTCSTKGRSIQDVDWRSVREGGLIVPKFGRPTERRLFPRNEQQQEAAKVELARNLLSLDPGDVFALGLLNTPGQPYKKTRYGLAPASSPMACQQSLLPHGFDVRVSGISPAAPSPAEALPAPKFFEGSDTWVPPTHLKENRILQVCLRIVPLHWLYFYQSLPHAY